MIMYTFLLITWSSSSLDIINVYSIMCIKILITNISHRFKMQLFIRSGTTHVLDVVDGQTVADVRAFISQAEDLPLAEVCCFSGCLFLLQGDTLGKCPPSIVS